MQWDSNRIGRNSRFGSEKVDKVKTPFIKGAAWRNLDKWSIFYFRYSSGARRGSFAMWKTQARMTLAAKVDLTPEEFGRRGQFYFGLSAFEGFEFTDAFTG